MRCPRVWQRRSHHRKWWRITSFWMPSFRLRLWRYEGLPSFISKSTASMQSNSILSNSVCCVYSVPTNTWSGRGRPLQMRHSSRNSCLTYGFASTIGTGVVGESQIPCKCFVVLCTVWKCTPPQCGIRAEYSHSNSLKLYIKCAPPQHTKHSFAVNRKSSGNTPKI